jgi:hypothetical protein
MSGPHSNNPNPAARLAAAWVGLQPRGARPALAAAVVAWHCCGGWRWRRRWPRCAPRPPSAPHCRPRPSRCSAGSARPGPTGPAAPEPRHRRGRARSRHAPAPGQRGPAQRGRRARALTLKQAPAQDLADWLADARASRAVPLDARLTRSGDTAPARPSALERHAVAQPAFMSAPGRAQARIPQRAARSINDTAPRHRLALGRLRGRRWAWC